METIKNLIVRNTTSEWQPGCGYMGNGNYYVGAIGRRGPGTNEEGIEEQRKHEAEMLAKGIPVNSEIPKALFFDLKVSKAEYEQIKDKHSDVQFVFSNIHKRIPNPDYEAQKAVYDREMEEFAVVQAKFNNFIKECERVAVDAGKFLIVDNYDNCGIRSNSYCPEETLRVLDEDNGTVQIRMHSGTELYQYLLKEGILEQRYPKWYRNGEY